MMKKLLCSLLFTVLTVGLVNSQSISVTGLGNPIPGDGSNVPVVTDDTDYGSVDVDTGGSITHTFTMTNDSGSNLLVGFNTITNVTGDGFSNGSITPPSVLGPGASRDFTIIFDPGFVGLNTAIVSIDINILGGGNETFTFNVEGTGTEVTAPDIDVLGNGQSIISQDPGNTPAVANDTDFGDVNVGSFIDRVFTIQNTGNANLLLNGAITVLISGGDGDFTVETPPGLTTLTPSGTANDNTTFTIRFTPSSSDSNPIEATVLIENNDPDINEQFFLFDLTGNGTTPSPEIDVQGLGTSIVGDGTNTPIVGDDTDFGEAVVGSGTVVHTFTILNTGDEDLNLVGTPAVEISGGDGDFVVTQQPTLTTIGGPLGSTTFEITFTPSSTSNPIQANVLIQNDDSDESFYVFNIEGDGLAANPEMDMLDNVGANLDVGGTVDFGSQIVTSGSTTFTFTIENNGSSDLNLTGTTPFVVIGGTNAADFTVTAVPNSSITPAGSTTFAITFDPTVIESKTATVSIANDDSDEDPYTFNLIGEGVDVGSDSQLMITQYYEGLDEGPGGTPGTDNWIEVKNISTTDYVSGGPGTVFLVLYSGISGTIIGGIETLPPTESIAIPSIPAGGVHLFSTLAGAGLPLAGNRGTATVTPTDVCNFNGDDIILISSSDEADSYDGRVDILGEVGATSAVNWGENVSLIKGCGTTELPTTTYIGDYITLTLDEVDNADSNTNIALGTQTVGATVWTTLWSNGIPDKTKETFINGTYTNSGGSFDSCNLTVNPGAIINFNSAGAGSNYILVDNNLTINGTFTLGDTESLITDEFGVITGSINKIETTTTLNNFRDFTYWSSPVVTTIESTFPGVERIFRWNTATSEWFPHSGSMTPAEGYIAEATPSTPDGGTHTVVFTGTPNNGGIGIPVQFVNDGVAGTDYNLIGNPYPSAIDIREFINYDIVTGEGVIQNNGYINGTVFLWTHNTQISGGTQGDFTRDDYAAVNLSGGIQAASGGTIPTFFIGSGQGFLVRTNGLNLNGGNVFFQNSMRVNSENNTPFFKSETPNEQADRIWLNMTTEEGGFSQILIGFFDGATDAEDRGYDGERLSASGVKLYSTIGEDKYGIQGLGTFNQSKEISVGMDTDVARTFKISIAKIEGILKDEDVYLADNKLGLVHDLKQGDYEFEILEAGNFSDRFTLKFNSGVLNTDDLELNNSFIVYSENGNLKLKASDEISKLKIYDITGRLLVESEPKSIAFDLPVENIKVGTVLILNATMKNGATISKKAIKY